MTTLEDSLMFQFQAVGLNPIRQYKFHPNRKYLADFGFPEFRLIVEVNGGIWLAKSGHNTGTGIIRDYKKSNCAQLMGYIYLQFTADEVNNGEALAMVEEYIGRSEK